MNGTGGIGTARNFCRTCSYASRQHHRLQILAAALFSTPAMLQHGAQWGDMVTMACARPDRDPEMLALDHIPPLGPARAVCPCVRSWCSPERRSTPLAPQNRPMQPAPGTAAWLTCPAQPDWSRAAGLPPLARTRALRGRTVSWRRSSIGGQGVRQPEVRLVLGGPPPMSRIEIPHEPPKRCGLTHQNPPGWALKVSISRMRSFILDSGNGKGMTSRRLEI